MQLNYNNIIYNIKQIIDFPNYYISDNGFVFKKINDNHKERTQWKLIKHYKDINSYNCIRLYNDSKFRRYKVHRLVAEYFVDNLNNKPYINHKNGIKDDNIFTNLEWTTISENTKHAYDNGLAKNDKGFEDSQSIPVKVTFIEQNLTKIYGSIGECSKDINVCKTTISRVMNRKNNIYKGNLIIEKYVA